MNPPPTHADQERARRIIWLLLRLQPHETDEAMVWALAGELAGMREEWRNSTSARKETDGDV